MCAPCAEAVFLQQWPRFLLHLLALCYHNIAVKWPKTFEKTFQIPQDLWFLFYFYLHMLAYTYTLLSDIVAKKFEHTTHAYALNCKVTGLNADFW